MRARIVGVQQKGVIVVLDKQEDAWLPSDEWSHDTSEWESASVALEPGDEIHVVPLHRRVEGRTAVSRKNVVLADLDDSWISDTREMRVHDIGKTLIRGTIEDRIPAVVNRQSYIDWLDTKQLPQELVDHAVLSRSDIIRGLVTTVKSGHDAVELDMREHMELEAQEIAGLVGKTLAPRDRNRPAAERQPLRKLRRDIATRINPVILVDNNSRCCESIAAMLRRDGIVVRAFSDFEESRTFLETDANVPGSMSRPGLAIIDPNLDQADSDLSGLTLAQSLVRANPNCRIVIMTGEVAHTKKLRDWPNLRIHGYVEKPFTMDFLVDIIQEAAELRTPLPLADWIRTESRTLPPSDQRKDSTDQSEITVQLALQSLVRLRRGTVAHVFELHPRSFRARSIDSAGGTLKWTVLRGKISKSVIKDTATAPHPIAETNSSQSPRHLWTRQMMEYESFYGVPVKLKGRLVALVAFHPDQAPFDQAFQSQAILAAEQIGRDLERRALTTGRRDEALLVSEAMALRSFAHELVSDLIALHGELALLTPTAQEETRHAPTLPEIRVHVTEMIERTRTLRGARASTGSVLVTDCLERASLACRTVVAETIADPHRIIIESCPPDSGAWYVAVPTSSLVMVFFNLYLNSAQQIDLASSVRRQGRIWTTIHIFEAGAKKHLRINIHDTGPGIHFDEWERVFDPGFSTKPNGSGLGLYICRHVLRDMMGTIRVASSRIWDGTTITVTLPLASQEGA